MELKGQSVTDATITSLKGIGRVERLSLYDTAVSDEGIAFIARNAPLHEISISSDVVTDTAIGYLCRVQSLRSLLIFRAPGVGDAAAELLSECTELRELYLNETRITDTAARCIAKVSTLQRLCLDGTALTDEGVAALGDLQRLSLLSLQRTCIIGWAFGSFPSDAQLSLDLDASGATDGGMAVLASHLIRLKRVSLNDTSITDATATALAHLKGLIAVQIARTFVTDQGVLAFKGHPTLQAIHLDGSSIAASTIKALKAANRRLLIYS